MKSNNLVYDVRPVSTIRELIETSAAEFGDRTAFVVKRNSENVEITYKEVLENVKALATFFNAEGLKGCKIAVIGKNSYEWSLTYLAAVCGTGVIVPVDKDLKAPEIKNIISLSGAQAVMCSKELEQTVESLDTDGLKKYCMSNMPEYLATGEEKRAAGDKSYETHLIDPFALGVLIYTSGTTGVAKGVMLSQHNICSDIVAVLKQVKITPDDRTLSVLPLHHTYESMTGFLSMLYAGGSITYMTSLTHLLADFREYQPTIFIAVPLLLKTIHSGIIKKVKAVPGGSLYLTVGKPLQRFPELFHKTLPQKFSPVFIMFSEDGSKPYFAERLRLIRQYLRILKSSDSVCSADTDLRKLPRYA